MKKGRHIIAGTRRVIRLGGSLIITLPAEFCALHGITEGDDLPFAANHIMKLIPMPEDKETREKIPGEVEESSGEPK
jgi:hypothetical protein